MATVVCDLDGVLAFPVDDHRKYSECEPNTEMVEVLRKLKERGHRIIIHTARWEEDREVTELWLKRNGFEYNEAMFEKPLGDVYIDDRALRYVAGKSPGPSLTLLDIERRFEDGD